MSAGRIAGPNSNAMTLQQGAAGVQTTGPAPTDRGAPDGKVRDVASTPMVGLGNMPSPPDGSDGAASVNISDRAKHRAEGHRRALDIARGTPDIREDRVAALKKQIDEGSYQPDPAKIADGMLREAIRDHLAESDH